MKYKKKDQKDYLVRKVLEFKKCSKRNLLTEFNDSERGAFIRNAVIGCPIPGTQKKIEKKNEFDKNWKKTITEMIFVLVKNA